MAASNLFGWQGAFVLNLEEPDRYYGFIMGVYKKETTSVKI